MSLRMNVPVVKTQPDGKRIDCFASGDEFFNYLHDKNGNIIVQNDAGWYDYATDHDGEPAAIPEKVFQENRWAHFAKNWRWMKYDDIDIKKHPELISCLYNHTEAQPATAPGKHARPSPKQVETRRYR